MNFWSILALFGAFMPTHHGWFHPPMRSVPEFSLEAYKGNWYEIARSKMADKAFERDCVCNYDNYELQHDSFYDFNYFNVRHHCRRGSVAADDSITKGRLHQWCPKHKPGALSISYMKKPAKHPNYYILAVGDSQNYGYVLIGEPWRRFLWIYSREKTLSDEKYRELEHIARDHGYMLDWNPLIRTQQEKCPLFSAHQEPHSDSKTSLHGRPLVEGQVPLQVQQV